MNKIVSIKKLSKCYHTSTEEIKAIENIDLDVYEEEFLTIVGSSGCGKSTLLSILGNLEESSSGDIQIDNDLKIGYMFQTDTLFSWLTILDNCLLGLKITKKLDDESKGYVIELLNKYGLGDFLYSYPNHLSGGMRQRVV